jgi:hypothetical protein
MIISCCLPGGIRRMARQVRALQVDKIDHRLQNMFQVVPGDAPRERGLGVQDGVPVGGLIEAVQQVGCVLAEQVHRRGVELRPAVPARDRHGRRRVLSPACRRMLRPGLS